MKCECKLRFLKIRKSFQSFLHPLELAMASTGRAHGLLEEYFPKSISSIFRIYLSSAQNASSFRTKKILFFSVLLFFNAFELAKSLYNGLINSNLARFYLFDFICTLQSNQIIFDFSFAITYVYTIRLTLKLLLGYNRNDVFNPNHLRFLDAHTERQLIEQQSFTAEDAGDYFELVKFIVKFIKWNIVVFCIGNSQLLRWLKVSQ